MCSDFPNKDNYIESPWSLRRHYNPSLSAAAPKTILNSGKSWGPFSHSFSLSVFCFREQAFYGHTTTKEQRILSDLPLPLPTFYYSTQPPTSTKTFPPLHETSAAKPRRHFDRFSNESTALRTLQTETLSPSHKDFFSSEHCSSIDINYNNTIFKEMFQNFSTNFLDIIS